MIEALHKLTEDMRGKVRLMVGRAILAAIADAGAIQTVQAHLLADETHDDMERIQEYGFTSVPLPGAEGVVVFVGGNRDHGLIIATDDRRYRLKGLQGGEVALYTDEGDSIILKRGHVIEVTTQTFNVVASAVVNLTTPTVNMSGDLNVAGDIVAQGDISDHGNESMFGMRQVYNGHTHPENDAGGPTGAPNQGM